MKERPIPFSAPMVRALLADIKTQTRRALRVQPIGEPASGHASFTRTMSKPVFYAIWYTPAPDGSTCCICPYGVPGDRLWVREAWCTSARYDSAPPRDIPPGEPITYLADGEHHRFSRYRPPMFMPRWACRITLEITAVRVERLQQITTADAIAEGIECVHVDSRGRQQWRMYPHTDGVPGPDGEVVTYVGKPYTSSPIESYKSLWLSINGPGTWDANPFVWVVTFKRVTP